MFLFERPSKKSQVYLQLTPVLFRQVKIDPDHESNESQKSKVKVDTQIVIVNLLVLRVLRVRVRTNQKHTVVVKRVTVVPPHMMVVPVIVSVPVGRVFVL